ncbi:MAG: permease-like cell division protein FtsX [Clostridium sp.]|mgnify:CR=1 FL=1|jgi:cell division transport system permease protein|nr:permease-like cell division protein FtsX [Clostridium sp.]
MKISTVNYFIGDAFKSFKRNKTISIATIITVLVTFIVLGTFSLVAENLNLAIGGLEDKIELVVYLNDDISPIDRKEVQVKINAQEGVKEIQYESREDAFKKLQENNAGILKGYTLEKNPLPASYIVKLEDMSYAPAIREAVKDLDGVESVSDEQESIDTIQSIIKFTKIIGTVLFVILVGVSIFLIMNTTKLTVYARRKEVGIMKFVGATDWFIRWPFIIEGILIGLIGTFLSVIALYFLYKFVISFIAARVIILNLIPISYIFTSLLWKFVLGGVLVGGFASYLALRKFLVV